ncbi:MAG TPA: UvrD-helicase domain-containing protein, partial [Candidatus Paceibacterota bacterium]|nr:UvrD-helicase domain-containing protein [Candidatus Paceibacterota bacterium]
MVKYDKRYLLKTSTSMEFTQEQKKIIAHDHTRNGVVRAGPGTGKSATVVALAERLSQEGSVNGVKFLTFTRAATAELAKKVGSALGLTIKPSTIHSFAIFLLMKNQDALPTQLPIRIPTDYET